MSDLMNSAEEGDEPREEDLPDKPPIDDRLATDEELEAEEEPGEQELVEGDFLAPEVAEQIDTVDDKEGEENA